MTGNEVKPGGPYGQNDDNIADADGIPLTPQPEIGKWTLGTMYLHDENTYVFLAPAEEAHHDLKGFLPRGRT